MAIVATTSNGSRLPDLTQHTRHWGDRAFRSVALASGVAVLVILALIAVTTTQKAWPAFSHEGIGFVTSDHWVPNEKSARDTQHSGAATIAVMVFVEGENRSRRRAARSKPFQHLHRQQIGAPRTVSEHVIAQHVGIGDDDDAPVPVGKPNGGGTSAHRVTAVDGASAATRVVRHEHAKVDALRRHTTQPADAKEMHAVVWPQRRCAIACFALGLCCAVRTKVSALHGRYVK